MTDHDRTPEALDRAIDAVVAGDVAAHPLAAAVRAGLQAGVRPAARAAHLEAIAAASPERRPEPDPHLRTVAPITSAPSRRGRRRVVVAAVAAVLLLTLGSSSAFAAAQGANPGDALYGVKRASERIALAMRRSPESKAALHLRFAERRLDEIDVLVGKGRDVDALVNDFEAELEAAGVAATDPMLAKIRQRTQRHIAHLTAILSTAPESARAGLERAIENAERQGERAEQRRIEKAEKKSGNRGGGEPEQEPGSGKTMPPGKGGDNPRNGKSK